MDTWVWIVIAGWSRSWCSAIVWSVDAREASRVRCRTRSAVSTTARSKRPAAGARRSASCGSGRSSTTSSSCSRCHRKPATATAAVAVDAVSLRRRSQGRGRRGGPARAASDAGPRLSGRRLVLQWPFSPDSSGGNEDCIFRSDAIEKRNQRGGRFASFRPFFEFTEVLRRRADKGQVGNASFCASPVSAL